MSNALPKMPRHKKNKKEEKKFLTKKFRGQSIITTSSKVFFDAGIPIVLAKELKLIRALVDCGKDPSKGKFICISPVSSVSVRLSFNSK